MTPNKERPLTSHNGSVQSQLSCGRIRLPAIFKVTSKSKCKLPHFKRREERNVEAKVGERTQKGENLPLPDWSAKFTEFMQANGQPKVKSSSAAHSLDESPSLDDLRTYAIHDEWQNAKRIYKREPKLKTTDPLDDEGHTALHLAVSFNRISFFNGLMDLMAPEDLEVPNVHGDTAFFMCASSGNVEFAKTMLGKNPGLAMIRGQHLNSSLFPIHLAALHGNRPMLQLLCPATILEDLDREQISVLFFRALENNIFDVAYALFKRYPVLAASRNEDQFTPLHVLALKSQEEINEATGSCAWDHRLIARLWTTAKFMKRLDLKTERSHEANVHEATGSCGWGHKLIAGLWTAAKFMERDEMFDLITKPSHILFDAAKSGNIKILDIVFQSHPELLMRKDHNKQNLFHIAVSSRQENLLIHLTKRITLANLLMLQVDRKGNNILHLAGMLPSHERFGSSRPHIQMQRELLWFKEVKNRVPTALKTMRNLEGLTPKDKFNREHAKLLVEAGAAAKDIANNGMLVATIITTIVFSASLTVPGHDVSPMADSSVLQKKGWYITFILSNSFALFSSSLSIIFFLSVLTSSFKDDEFISSLQVRLTFGVTTLFVATTSMVVAFTAACFLIFNHLSTWVAYLVASLGGITVALSVFLLYNLFGDLIRSLYWSRHLFQPTNYYQRLKYITVVIRKMKNLSKTGQTTEAKKRLQADKPVAEP